MRWLATAGLLGVRRLLRLERRGPVGHRGRAGGGLVDRPFGVDDRGGDGRAGRLRQCDATVQRDLSVQRRGRGDARRRAARCRSAASAAGRWRCRAAGRRPTWPRSGMMFGIGVSDGNVSLSEAIGVKVSTAIGAPDGRLRRAGRLGQERRDAGGAVVVDRRRRRPGHAGRSFGRRLHDQRRAAGRAAAGSGAKVAQVSLTTVVLDPSCRNEPDLGDGRDPAGRLVVARGGGGHLPRQRATARSTSRARSAIRIRRSSPSSTDQPARPGRRSAPASRAIGITVRAER